MKKNKDYRFENIEYKKENGYTIRGRLYLPLEQDGPYRTAIMAHGYGSCFRDFMHYGPMFAREKLALCVFDFCGGSPRTCSDGKTTEMSVLTELDDYKTVLSEVKKHPEVDADNVFLMGESQGGYVAALLGSRYPELSRGMVLWYPSVWMLKKVLELAEPVTTDYLNIWGVDLGRMYVDDMKTIDLPKEIASYEKEVLIIQGDKDPIVLPEMTLKTIETFPNAKLFMIPGAGHGFEGEQSELAGKTSIEYIKNYGKER